MVDRPLTVPQLVRGCESGAWDEVVLTRCVRVRGWPLQAARARSRLWVDAVRGEPGVIALNTPDGRWTRWPRQGPKRIKPQSAGERLAGTCPYGGAREGSRRLRVTLSGSATLGHRDEPPSRHNL